MGMILALVGAAMLLIGWIWLVITGFTKGGILWGILTFFFSWIAGLIFYVTKKEGLTPTLLILGGIVLSILGRAIGN